MITSGQRIAIFAINAFGRGGHPEATLGNLDEFGREYITQCLRRVVASPKTSATAKEQAARCIRHEDKAR